LWGTQRILRQQVNRIRWSIYDRYDNSVWDAKPYLINFDPNAQKVAHHNEAFGGNVGGPLSIPHVYDGKDKTFFFVNYNLDRQQSLVDSFAQVPTLAERGQSQAPGEQLGVADFCGVTTPNGTPIELFSSAPKLATPLTGGCTIPAADFDPAAKALLEFIPEPNVAGAATGNYNYHLQTSVPVASDTLNTHVLHTINSKLNLNVGYHFSSTRQEGIQNFPRLLSNVSARGQSANVGLSENISPTLLNSIQISWNRSRVQTLNGFAFDDNIASQVGIAGVSTAPIDYGLPLINFTNFSSWTDPVPSLVRNQTYRFMDNVTSSRRAHTFQAGAEVRRIENNSDTDPTPRGQFVFTGTMTSQLGSSGLPVAGTGYDFADFLLGLPDTAKVQFGSSSNYFRSWGLIGYAQDDWRATPRFTLQYGLRYELFTPFTELNNHLADLSLNSSLTAATLICPVATTGCTAVSTPSLIHPQYDHFAPRLGFAWRPKEKAPLVVRAGYGIFFNESIYSQLVTELANQPPWAQSAATVTNSPSAPLTLENALVSAPPGTLSNTQAVNPNYKVGYAQIWNFSLEWQIKPSWVLTTTYTGTKGTDLDLLMALNRETSVNPPVFAIPGAQFFTEDTSGANSIYNALQILLQHRFAHGLMFRAVYTYGRSMDDASSIGGSTPVVVQNNQNIAADWGLSSFDMRHQFTSIWVYELPFGQRKAWLRKGLGAHLLGNLRLNGVATMHTGTPYTALVSGNLAGCSGTTALFSQRANQVGDPNLPASERTPLEWFNTSAFQAPACGSYGTAPRNSITGPGLVNVNAGLTRWFLVGEDGRHRLEARWEAQNLFNTPNFTGLSTVVNSQTFGRVLGALSMRTMDVNLRYVW
jgi:hypothetical protein